ncbi:MAG: hypothetical protein R6X19_10155 [Kiritimatiellia bacterium]
MADKEILRFDNLGQYLLLKNGNYLYKVPFRNGRAVLKVYYGSRSVPSCMLKSFDNVVMNGQTSYMPKTRLKNEQASMKIWREAGIRVFNIYDNVEVEGLPPGGYALYEYVPGRNFHKYLPDESVPLEERLRWYRIFLEQWHRRHALACRTRNPMLIHENGDIKHVMLHNNELYWFDFEMVFRSGAHIEDLVARELLAYIKTLRTFLSPERFDLFLKETLERYPDRNYLELIYPYMFKNRKPLHRLGRWIDFNFKAKSRKPDSKYQLALLIRDYLAAHPRSAG